MARTTDPDRLSRMIQAAHLHFEMGQSKSDIAKTLDTSPTEVGRLLVDAQAGGYVTIHIEPPLNLELERKLKNYWELKGATVVSAVPDYEYQRKLLGRAAANHFLAQIVGEKVRRVAVSGGGTMSQMAAAVKRIETEVEIFPTALIGRGGRITHADPASVVTQLFLKGKDNCVKASLATVLPLEGTDSDPRAAQGQFLERQKVKEVADGMHSVDVVYSGIGWVTEDEQHQSSTPAIRFLSEIGVTLKSLYEKGAIGDVNYCFFNELGEALGDDVFISLTVTDLKEMVKAGKDVVLTAGHKERPIRAALRGRLCSHLITDEDTAAKLCA